LAGVSPPAETRFDGEDLSATLTGRSTASRQQPLFWRRPPDRKSWPQHGLEAQPDLAVRAGPWKLLCDYDGSKPELHHLLDDLGETTNRASSEPAVVARLTRAVTEWHQSMPPDHGPALAAEPPPAKRKGKKK